MYTYLPRAAEPRCASPHWDPHTRSSRSRAGGGTPLAETPPMTPPPPQTSEAHGLTRRQLSAHRERDGQLEKGGEGTEEAAAGGAGRRDGRLSWRPQEPADRIARFLLRHKMNGRLALFTPSAPAGQERRARTPATRARLARRAGSRPSAPPRRRPRASLVVRRARGGRAEAGGLVGEGRGAE